MATLKVIWNQEVCAAEGAGGNIPPYIGHRHMMTVLGAMVFEDNHFGIDFGEAEDVSEITIEGTVAQLTLFKRCLDNGDWPSEEEVSASARELLTETNGKDGEHAESCRHYLGDVKRIATSIEIVP